MSNNRRAFEKRADRYVQEYREEWQRFLNDRRERWQIVATPGGSSLGVYETYLSPNVALRVGTSITCGDKVCDYADASIKTYLYSVGPNGACARITPSKSKSYLQGILENTQNTTGVKWRKRIDTWKKWVTKSLDAAIKQYKSNKAYYERIAINADRVCGGDTADIGEHQREIYIVRATWYAMDALLKKQLKKGSDFGVAWLTEGKKIVERIGNTIRKTGVPSAPDKAYIKGVYAHKAFGRELLGLAKAWLRSQRTGVSDFKGKLAGNEFPKKAAKELLQAASLMKEVKQYASRMERTLKEAAKVAKSAQPGFRDNIQLLLQDLGEDMVVVHGSSAHAEELWQGLSWRIDQIGMGMYASAQDSDLMIDLGPESKEASPEEDLLKLYFGNEE